MDDFIDRYGPVRVWAATVALLASAITLGAILFPHRVYVDIIWHYFWGPVVADAHGWNCVTWAGGNPVECVDAPGDAGPTASPGYTVQSYAGYIPTLVILLIGILFIIERLDIERYRAGFYGLLPYFFFGGVLRVVEDANVAAYRATGELPIQMPWNGLLISPFTYGVVFVFTLVALIVSVWLERNDYVSGYEYPLAGIGTAALATTLGYLGYIAVTEPYATFYPELLLVTLAGAAIATAITWLLIQRFAPGLNQGTQYMGLVVIWAHAVDGFANVIGLDWATTFGHSTNMGSKHPLNEWIHETTSSVLPADVIAVIGDAWPFLLVKLAAAVFVIWIFDETVFEDSPRYAILLMITVVAVGLGPGTRDMIRATFGI